MYCHCYKVPKGMTGTWRDKNAIKKTILHSALTLTELKNDKYKRYQTSLFPACGFSGYFFKSTSSTVCSQVEKQPPPWAPMQRRVTYRSTMWAVYPSVLSGDVTLCMQTLWKWAAHTEDEVGRKTPVSRVWSRSHHWVPLHFLDEPPWSSI